MLDKIYLQRINRFAQAVLFLTVYPSHVTDENGRWSPTVHMEIQRRWRRFAGVRENADGNGREKGANMKSSTSYPNPYFVFF